MSAATATPPADLAKHPASYEDQPADPHASETPSADTLRPTHSPTTAAASVNDEGVAKDIEKAEHAAATSPPESIKPSAKAATAAAQDPNLVVWDDSNGPDPSNPHNWPKSKKWAVILIVSTCSLCVTCNSSIVSATFTAISEEFGFGHEVAVLGLSLFVTGLGLGPVSRCIRAPTGMMRRRGWRVRRVY